jgi:hypothetical protein
VRLASGNDSPWGLWAVNWLASSNMGSRSDAAAVVVGLLAIENKFRGSGGRDTEGATVVVTCVGKDLTLAVAGVRARDGGGASDGAAEDGSGAVREGDGAAGDGSGEGAGAAGDGSGGGAGAAGAAGAAEDGSGEGDGAAGAAGAGDGALKDGDGATGV